MLHERLGLPHISTGDMLRSALTSPTLSDKVRQELHESVVEGKRLVSDALMRTVVADRLGQPDCRKGYLLDGYPRTLQQARDLDEIAKPDYVFELDVPDTVSVNRLSNRWNCKACGAIYGLNVAPKTAGICDKCGGQLFRRPDDEPEKIRNRLATYHRETKPLIEHYRPLGIVYRVDGDRKPEKVLEDVLKIVGPHP
jgi:adenylate kinase